MNWTRAERIVCPDCGFEFGFRTAAGSLNLSYNPEDLQRRCTRVAGPNLTYLACLRFEELKSEADQSERTSPQR